MYKMNKMLKEEFINGKAWFDWAFLLIGLLMQAVGVAYGFMTGTPDSVGLIISGFAGVLSVILCSQQKISFYLFGFVQLFTYVFCFTIPNALHGETIENVMYFVTMIYGIYVWMKNYRRDFTNDSIEVKARRLSVKGNVITAVIFVVCTYLYYLFLKNVPMFGVLDSDPFVDSITSVPAYIAQVFMVLGFCEQWIYWFILDVGSIVLAARAGSPVMVAQFIFWTMNCVYGYVKWVKSSKSDTYTRI